MADVSEDNAQAGLKDCPKNEQLAEKQSFEGSCEILRTIFQPNPRQLSSDISASQRGVYLFYNPLINFFNVLYCGKKENKNSDNRSINAGGYNKCKLT